MKNCANKIKCHCRILQVVLANCGQGRNSVRTNLDYITENPPLHLSQVLVKQIYHYVGLFVLMCWFLPRRLLLNQKCWEPNKMPFFWWWEMRFIFSCYVTDALSGCSCGPLSNNMFVFRSIFVQPTATDGGNPVWPLSPLWWKHRHLVTSRRQNVNFSLSLM